MSSFDVDSDKFLPEFVIRVVGEYIESIFEDRRAPEFDDLYLPVRGDLESEVINKLYTRYPRLRRGLDIDGLIRFSYNKIRFERGDSKPIETTSY